MASSLDRNLISKVRRVTGATDANKVTRRALEDELSDAKEVIETECRRLNGHGNCDFGGGAAKTALEHYLYLRVSDMVASTGPYSHDHVSVPRSPAHIRRIDFEDTQRNYWRDRMVRALTDI